MATTIEHNEEGSDLESLTAEFLAEYASIIQRLAVGDQVPREEVRSALLAVNVSMHVVRRDVDKLRSRMRAAAEIEEVQVRRADAEKVHANAQKLAAEIASKRQAFEESLRPLNERLHALQLRSTQLQSSTSMGEQIHELRAGARPEIEQQIHAVRKRIQAEWGEAGDLRRQVPQLQAMIEVAPLAREGLEEFRETGHFFNRLDKHGKPVSRYWVGNLVRGTPPEKICIAQCEKRVERLENAANQLAAVRQRIDVEIPNRIRELEAEIDRLAASQLHPMAMQFGVNDA